MTDPAEYAKYVERFEKALGALEVGAYGKWKGHLIKRLSPEDFEVRHSAYRKLAEEFQAAVDRGYTISNQLMRQLREHAAELVLSTHA